MNDMNRTRLLELYNQIYEEETIPLHFNEAHVVQIYKQGKPPEAYSSYRPIALLNITYKILAKMLQNRLREALDERLVSFQYGHRKGKSTAEPIFIARRTQDLAERTGRPLYMLALDYSKAFDSGPGLPKHGVFVGPLLWRSQSLSGPLRRPTSGSNPSKDLV